MKITKIALANLKPLEKNVRKHNEGQIKELVRSLNDVGQTRAMVVDEDNNILIGNGLYMAMLERGDTEADCYVIKGLDEKAKKKLILSDNKIFRLGFDDYDVINEFIKDIALEGDFDIPGFEEDILKRVIQDVDGIDDVITNYGSVPETSLGETVSVAESPTVVQSAAQAQAQDQTPVAEASSPLADSTVPNGKYIVCPKCGEVIRFD